MLPLIVSVPSLSMPPPVGASYRDRSFSQVERAPPVTFAGGISHHCSRPAAEVIRVVARE